MTSINTRVKVFTLLIIFMSPVQGTPIFKKEQSPKLAEALTIDAKALCQVAQNTAQYIGAHPDDHYAVHDGKVENLSVSLKQAKQALAFICKTYREDVAAKRDSRLKDPKFIAHHFDFIRWYPDTEKAQQVAQKSNNEVKSRMLNSIPKDKLFLTKYYAKQIIGSERQTTQYSQALYALPFDEQGLSKEQALARKTQLTRFRFTRQQIIEGVLLEEKLAKPLVWLTEEALHDVLLQGTGVLNIDGKTRYFNVHRNNGIAYDYHIGKREQARYWYFAEVPSVLGYGKTIEEKIPLANHVALAGNVKQLGIGRLFMLNYPANGKQYSHMAVLADEGGAFDDNLFQLDWLVGSYYGWKDYYQANKHIPDYADVWMLVLKSDLAE